jgi:hypothetical protein
VILGFVNAILSKGALNGELYLTVWDQTGQRSYTRDLGITMDTFGTANAPANAGFASFVDTTASSNLNIAGDTNWGTFITGQSAGQVATYQWSVYAGDSNGTSAQGQTRVLYTSKNDDQASAALPGVWVANNASVSSLSTLIINNDSNVVALNGADNNPSINNSYIITDPSSFAYAGFQAGVFSGKAANLNPYASVGESQNFFYATRSGSSNAGEALFTKYGNASGASAWTLAADGSLNFTPPVAPVPEPGEWAMLLAGLAVVGSMARRRMSSHV